jgi:ATP-dependent DNA ligase
LKLPELAIDTELVMLDERGHPTFERLIWRSRLKKRISIEHGARSEPAALFAFDLLELKGKDVRTWPLLDRKALLEKTLKRSKRIRYTDHVDDGQGLFKAAESLGLEGIVAKRADSPYRRGRSGDWIKVKTGAGRAIDEERSTWNER